MKINLQTNKTEQKRIDELMEDIINNPKSNALVMREEFELKQFFGSDYDAMLEYLETNDINFIKTINIEPKTKCNLCIIEMRDVSDTDIINISNAFTGRKDLIGVVINKNLPTKYRINYLHK